MSDSFDEMYRPSEEHEAFRAAVRELCEEKVAPHAAEADELAEFPKASYEALVSADFHAPHIPEAYSGVGADALATYQFNTRTAQHLFCSVCGVKSFYVPRSHPEGYSVTVRCLDEGTLEGMTIVHKDGKNWEKTYGR